MLGWPQIFDLETRYLANSNPHGNAIKGADRSPVQSIVCAFDERLGSTTAAAGTDMTAPRSGYEGFLTGSTSGSRKLVPRPEERLFSYSSVTGTEAGEAPRH